MSEVSEIIRLKRKNVEDKNYDVCVLYSSNEPMPKHGA